MPTYSKLNLNTLLSINILIFVFTAAYPTLHISKSFIIVMHLPHQRLYWMAYFEVNKVTHTLTPYLAYPPCRRRQGSRGDAPRP